MEESGAKPSIVVIDYHKGNLRSMARGLERAGAEAIVSDDPAVIGRASGLVLPGVGAFADAMAYIESSGQKVAILDAISRGVPFLGVCLGAQLLLSQGSEGAAETGAAWIDGLGVIPGKVVLMPAGEGAKVPHVGWNTADLTDRGRTNPLFAGIEDATHFYFTHSYICCPTNSSHISAITTHAQPFASALWDGNTVFGVQFHPEKSSDEGARLLSNFVGIVGERASADAGGAALTGGGR
jgi:glutamine amidotransferase